VAENGKRKEQAEPFIEKAKTKLAEKSDLASLAR
jgi:hypothetical protein